MKEEALLIGYAVLAVITLASFVGIIYKFTQPINNLNVVIQKLNDNIESLTKDNHRQDKRLDQHGKDIDHLKDRVGKVETKVSLYHDE